MTEKQCTIKAPVQLKGVGLHTGELVNIEICPAPADHGYKFQRVDLPEQPIIKADIDLVVSTERGTTLESKGARVYTTEHVLAALYGCQADNMASTYGFELPSIIGISAPSILINALST